MPKHLLKWKSVRHKDRRGTDVEFDLPELVEISYRGSLLSTIIQMPLKNPISFDDAIRMALDKKREASKARQLGYEPGCHGWYSRHFVEWISSLGFHIELTGDEFDVVSPSQFAN